MGSQAKRMKQKYGEKCPSRSSLVVSPVNTLHSYAKNKATIVDINPENTPFIWLLHLSD